MVLRRCLGLASSYLVTDVTMNAEEGVRSWRAGFNRLVDVMVALRNWAGWRQWVLRVRIVRAARAMRATNVRGHGSTGKAPIVLAFVGPPIGGRTNARTGACRFGGSGGPLVDSIA